MLLIEYAIEWWFIIPPLLTNVSALPGETWTRKLSFQYATNMCLLLENVGGSEQNRSVIANVQSDDLWPSRMHRSGEMNCGVSCSPAAIAELSREHGAPVRRPAETRTYRKCDACLAASASSAKPRGSICRLWPPNSTDLNPVDYRIWGWMQEHVYKTPVCDTDDLKRRLIDTWASIPQSVVDDAIDQWTIRLRACGKARGLHFEHLL